MSDFVEWLPKWNEIRGHLDNKRSVLLHAPRNSGKSRILSYIAKSYAVDVGAWCIALSSTGTGSTGAIDYAQLWSTVVSQVGKAPKRKVFNKISFSEAFRALLKASRRRVILLLRGARRGNEENHKGVMGLFHDMIEQAAGQWDFVVVATDDYSCAFHNQVMRLPSAMPFFKNVHYNLLDGEDLEECIKGILRHNVYDDSHGTVKSIVADIEAFGGGHPGLASEMIDYMEQRKWQYVSGCFDSFIRNPFAHSDVLVSLERVLEEDVDGYCETALEYGVPAFPEVNSPRIHVLQETGVLQRMATGCVRLCPGAIGKLISEMRTTRASKSRVGTTVDEVGVRRFEPGPMSVEDDDFVIVHLSDLHVGKDYRYRLAWAGNSLNPGERSAEELLREDLDGLSLLGRVDALVITGDFVGCGNVSEFRRARDVIEAVMKALSLSIEQLITIAGNHDVEWDPGTFAGKGLNPRVSMENYHEFAKGLGLRSGNDICVHSIKSRGGGRLLEIIGLDSNRVEGPDAGGIGYVSRETLEEARQLLDAKKYESDVSVDRVMLVHHHLLPCSSVTIEHAQTKRVSVMANAAEVLDCANRWGVDLILHGHEHQPTITVARRWPVGDGMEFNAVTVAGAGSFSVKREHLGPFARNQYYIIWRRQNETIIRSRCIGDNGVSFVPHNDIAFPRANRK